MRTIILAVCLAASSSWAGEVYKCKGPNGEVTFTNIRCPEKTAAQHYGSYTPAQDAPDPYLAQQQNDEAVRAADGAASSTAPRQPSRRDQVSDLVSALSEDQRSVAGRQARRDRLQREAEEADLAQPHRKAGARVEPPSVDDDTASPASIIRNCTGNGNAMTCFGSDGSISNGHVANGNATMFGSDGSIRQMPVKSKNGATCTQFGDAGCN